MNHPESSHMLANEDTVRYPRVILGTCLVPWREDGTCDTEMFRVAVRHSVQTLTPHLYIFGTAGEGHAVGDGQFRDITKAFVEEMNLAGATPMVGIISLSLPTILERIEYVRELGVREVQISLPSWGALNDAELDRFFAATCGQFEDMRFLHYNLARAGRVLKGAEYARLAARHPNLVAVKMSGEIAALADVLHSAPMLRCFFTEFGYTALADAPNCGFLCALGCCEPRLAREFFAADENERRQMEPTFRAIHTAVKIALGADAHMDGAYDKMFLKLNMPEFPLRLLAPYSNATDAQFDEFRDAVRAILPATTTFS